MSEILIPSVDLLTLDHRTRLLVGMARAVAAKGYGDTTLADIVAEANVSRRTFYEHFTDKADCLMALYALASDRVGAIVRERVDAAAPPEVRMRQALEGYFGTLASNPVLLRTLFTEILAMGERGLAARREAYTRLMQLLLDVAGRRPARAGRKHLGLQQVAMAVVGGINELVLWQLEQGRTEALHELVGPAGSLLQAALMTDTAPDVAPVAKATAAAR